MFLGEVCVQHGAVGVEPCCTGLNPWKFDENGNVYPILNGQQSHACWYASCVPQGKAAGPGGVGNYCCPPLVNVNGKCGYQTTGGGAGTGTTAACTTAGKAPLVGGFCCSGLYVDRNGLCNTSDFTTGSGSGSLIPGIDNTMLMVGAGGLLLLLLMTGKKR